MGRRREAETEVKTAAVAQQQRASEGTTGGRAAAIVEARSVGRHVELR